MNHLRYILLPSILFELIEPATVLQKDFSVLYVLYVYSFHEQQGLDSIQCLLISTAFLLIDNNFHFVGSVLLNA